MTVRFLRAITHVLFTMLDLVLPFPGWKSCLV